MNKCFLWILFLLFLFKSPFEIFGQPSTILATSPNTCWAITVDANYVYWTELGAAIRKVPKSGGTVQTLANITGQARAIAVYGGYVYWAESSPSGYDIKMVPSSGGSVTTIASDHSMASFMGVYGLAVDSSGVYWAQSGTSWLDSGSIKKLPGPVNNPTGLAHSNPAALATTLASSEAMTIDSDSVYWDQETYGNGFSSSVAKVGKNGGAVTTLMTNLGEPDGIAVDGTYVYFSIWNDSVYRVPKNGGTISSIGPPASSEFVALDSYYVYAGNYFSQGTLGKAPKSGGSATFISDGENGTVGIAADQSGVYWTEGDGNYPPSMHIRALYSSPPTITGQPESQLSNLGATVTFHVTASGTGPLTYQWQLNDANIPNQTSANLVLDSITEANVGNYTVIVSDPYGPATSAQATLKLLAVDTTIPCYLITAIPVPDRQVGKNKLVLVTHGWQWTVENPSGPPAQTWLDNYTNQIALRLSQSGHNDWQVEKYEWLSNAWTFYPVDALNNAQIIGAQIGDQIAGQGWQQVHLIAHSAGAGLIQAATDEIHKRAPGIIVQETFLDPYTGPYLEGRNTYGQNTSWADDYFVFDPGTDLGGVGLTVLLQLQAPASTSGKLNWSFNVDVGATVQAEQLPFYYGDGVLGSEPQYITVVPDLTHGTPIDFYYSTILGTEKGCANGYGFDLSMEAGGAIYWPNLPTNNSPLALCGNSSFSQTPQPINLNSLFNLATQPSGTSDLGVNLLNNSATLTANSTPQTEVRPGGAKPADSTSSTSTVWLATGLTISNAVNFVQFDASFADTNNAEGLLTVLWDTNQIGTVDERVAGQSPQTYRFFLPNTVSNGLYVLSYRLDAFNDMTSAIVVTNVAAGFYGLTSPINLDISITNGASLLKVTAPTNFVYLIEASTNLTDWTPMAMLLNTNSVCRFLDTTRTNSDRRFYRVLLQ